MILLIKYLSSRFQDKKQIYKTEIRLLYKIVKIIIIIKLKISFKKSS